MEIQAGIRTPADVIGLPIEDAGVPHFQDIADDAARRLALCLKQLSRPDAVVMLRENGGKLEWATVRFIAPLP